MKLSIIPGATCVRVKTKWRTERSRYKVLEYSKEGSGKRVWNRMEGDGTLWKVLERSRGRRNRAAKRALRKKGGKFEIGSAKRDEKRTNEQS